MKISINNFKSIGSLSNYELKPMTVLSGTNSSGKSSFIQLLLLLKQTIELDSSKYPLRITGDYSVKNYIDIIKNKDKSNKLAIGFKIDKREFEKYGEKIEKSIFDSFPDYTSTVNLVFDFFENDIYIKEFLLSYVVPGKDNYVKFIQDKNVENSVQLDFNNEVFIKSISDDIPATYISVNYSSIFPSSVEVIRSEQIENPAGDGPLINKIKTNEYPNLNPIKSFFKNFFSDLCYIGPLRTEPKDSYPNDNKSNTVGIEGEHVAQILTQRQAEKVNIAIPFLERDPVEFQQAEMTLLEAINIWMCKIFKFSKKIYAKESGDNYSIILVNQNDVETTIKHVGFGISQVLPIIVQGLLLRPGSTLILEQPEIHLHPKVQSLLFDFLYSLIVRDINVIIETHSDHFITRMRRRIAEDETSTLKDKINLTFVEQDAGDLVFKTLNLDDLGVLNYFPNDFIERSDIELKALIKAQMKKRIAKKL